MKGSVKQMEDTMSQKGSQYVSWEDVFHWCQMVAQDHGVECHFVIRPPGRDDRRMAGVIEMNVYRRLASGGEFLVGSHSRGLPLKGRERAATIALELVVALDARMGFLPEVDGQTSFFASLPS
jgi:hypothetical protein